MDLCFSAGDFEADLQVARQERTGDPSHEFIVFPCCADSVFDILRNSQLTVLLFRCVFCQQSTALCSVAADEVASICLHILGGVAIFRIADCVCGHRVDDFSVAHVGDGVAQLTSCSSSLLNLSELVVEAADFCLELFDVDVCQISVKDGSDFGQSGQDCFSVHFSLSKLRSMLSFSAFTRFSFASL